MNETRNRRYVSDNIEYHSHEYYRDIPSNRVESFLSRISFTCNEKEFNDWLSWCESAYRQRVLMIIENNDF